MRVRPGLFDRGVNRGVVDHIADGTQLDDEDPGIGGKMFLEVFGTHKFFQVRPPVPGKRSQIPVQALLLFLGKPRRIEKTECFQPPDDDIDPFEQVEAVQQGSGKRAPTHALPAENEIDQLFARVPDQLPVAALVQDLDQLEKMGDPLEHAGPSDETRGRAAQRGFRGK